MKKLALVLALTLTAFAGSAMAIDYSSNNVGIYSDEAGTENCITSAIFTPIPAYLVFTQMTATDISAWEIALSYENVLLLSFTPRGQHIMASPRAGEAMVGLAAPAPVTGGTYVAADVSLMVQNINPAGVKAAGVFFHLLPYRAPAYINSLDVPFELYPIGEPGAPIMTINGGCVVSEETTSFGGVKSLFR